MKLLIIEELHTKKDRDLQMNFLNFPYFSRLFKPNTVN